MLSKRWFGMTIKVSTLCFSSSMPSSAWRMALFAFEDEWLGHHADRQRADFSGDPRHHRRTARTGAAAHAGGDEDHVGALEVLPDLLLILQCRAPADLRIGARAQSLGHRAAQLYPDWRLARFQRLRVGIRHHEIDTGQSGADHGVDRVAAAATDTDDLDPRGHAVLLLHYFKHILSSSRLNLKIFIAV